MGSKGNRYRLFFFAAFLAGFFAAFLTIGFLFAGFLAAFFLPVFLGGGGACSPIPPFAAAMGFPACSPIGDIRFSWVDLHARTSRAT